MYDMKHVGKYNVDFAGETYDEGVPYDTVIIEEFDRYNKPTGIKKRSILEEIEPRQNNISCRI